MGSFVILSRNRPSGGDFEATVPSGIRSHFDALEMQFMQVQRTKMNAINLMILFAISIFNYCSCIKS
jgi:hypothetical protein